jgi:hypothetical protein
MQKEQPVRSYASWSTTLTTKDFILLGSFDDNPDDRSLNILETADPNALGSPKVIDGPFLSNLTEPPAGAAP